MIENGIRPYCLLLVSVDDSRRQHSGDDELRGIAKHLGKNPTTITTLMAA
jgi:hypothetical protein